MSDSRNEKYSWDAFLVALAIGIPLLSLVMDVRELYRSKEILWFGRSGSLVVLFAVVLEYRQQLLTEATQINNAFGKPLFKSGKEMNEVRRSFHITALSLSVIGTIIWGYGDIPFLAK